jgi:CRISPR-associated protein Cas2
MFVAVMSDVSSDDHRLAVQRLLVQYGFNKTMKDLYESTTISESALTRLKRDIDRATDSYDTIRLYQYPVQDTLVISSLKEKRWRKLVVRTP